jgi:hypothetical protein
VRSSVSFANGSVSRVEPWHLYVDVDAIQQRSGDALPVAADDAHGAGAFPDGIAVVAARAVTQLNRWFCSDSGSARASSGALTKDHARSHSDTSLR